MAAVDVFADVGVELYHEGTLAEGLELLAARLDLAGAGEFLAWVTSVEFTGNDKRDPQPTPTPKPPPDPKPQQPKGSS